MITFEQTQQDVVEVKNDLKELKALLLQKAETKDQTDDPKSIEEIEKLTGYTKPTLYGYCQKNTIPHHKKNGRLFFFKSEIIDWIKQGKRKTITEVGVETDTLLSKKKNLRNNGQQKQKVSHKKNNSTSVSVTLK
ncbi:helix-turn-helix domain-containing protein [Thalassobellus suaedae]|uniref:Helix-turn-helix domain-containing protein n=1 Tax=Thalassobellus suaedae TaxID=3074124 RepID=A0ABY9XPN1_9FLAO|nr:helix-turn-helix domain-containing protein [Flavobacteriaceae bacterium HL-DH14]